MAVREFSRYAATVPRAPTILVSDDDRSRFGFFLHWALRLSGKDESWLADEFHKGAASKHERRKGYIKEYLSGDRIPDEENLEVLCRVLDVPRPAMYCAAGYMDLVLGRLATAAEHNETVDWHWEQTPRVAAFERLFSLFPTIDMDASIDQTASLFYILEKMGRLNIGGERDRLHTLWPFWFWVAPEPVRREHLIHKEYQKVTNASEDPLASGDHLWAPFDAYRAIRAEREISLVDPIGEQIFSQFEAEVSKETQPLLFRALGSLKDQSQTWKDRAQFAGRYVNQWADQLDEQRAKHVRGRLRGMHERPITQAEEELLLGWIGLNEREAQPRKILPKFE